MSARKLARALPRRGFSPGAAPIRIGRLIEPTIVVVLGATIAALFWSGLR